MSVSIEQAFVRQYEAEVHVAYQRMGSKLRPTVRTKSNVRGSHATFQRVGAGVASSKGRNGIVPVMNIEHAPVNIYLQDFYAGDWVDYLDEIKINHDEKMVLVNAGAYALGRKTDQLIVASLENNTDITEVSADSTTDPLHKQNGLTKERILHAFEQLGHADVPDDGQRFAIVGWKQWSELMAIDEFTKADYIGGDDLPWKGTQAKRWLGTLWMPHSGLPSRGSNNRTRNCYWYHKTAVGHVSAKDVQTDITWHGDRAAYFINNMISQGAEVIDPNGIVRIPCVDPA